MKFNIMLSLIAHEIHHVKLLVIKTSTVCPVTCTEGLAVGVGFGAIGKTPSATFVKAR